MLSAVSLILLSHFLICLVSCILFLSVSEVTSYYSRNLAVTRSGHSIIVVW